MKCALFLSQIHITEPQRLTGISGSDLVPTPAQALSATASLLGLFLISLRMKTPPAA